MNYQIEQRCITNNSNSALTMGRMRKRLMVDKVSKCFFLISTLFALVVLGVLLYRIFSQSIGWLNISFLTSKLSIFPHKAGIYTVIVGSLWLMVVVIPIALIVGVSTAIYLEEYATKGRLHQLIKINISNLAGVPSIIYGMLGLTVFSRMLNMGSSILAGGLTMSLLVLPIVVVSSQEAIRNVPTTFKDAAYAMGASKWEIVSKIVIPVAIPGILTGSILALSRAIGETAPLVALGIPTLILRMPTSVMDNFTVLPIQIYYWTMDAVLRPEYANLAAATIVVLLTMLFLMNSVAIFIRNKYQQRY